MRMSADSDPEEASMLDLRIPSAAAFLLASSLQCGAACTNSYKISDVAGAMVTQFNYKIGASNWQSQAINLSNNSSLQLILTGEGPVEFAAKLATGVVVSGGAPNLCVRNIVGI